jgi:phage tail-like protein
MPTEELFGAYHFQLEVSGVRIGSFRSIRQSAGAGAAVAERRDPAGLKWNPRSMKMGNAKPGAALDDLGASRSSTFVLEGFRPERGQERVVRGGASALARKPGTIVLLDPRARPVARWNFTNAWPPKASGPTPKAAGNDVPVEEFSLVFEHIRRVP